MTHEAKSTEREWLDDDRDEAPCLCDDIDPSDRPCLVCEALATLGKVAQP